MYSFIVKIKQIKGRDRGLLNYYNYLTNEHDDKIKKIFGNEETIKNIILNNLNRELEILKRGKGGRKLSNFGTSLLFTFPPEIKMEEVYKKEILRSFFDMLLEHIREYSGELEVNEIKKNLFINLHYNTKHTHINVILGNVIGGNKIDFTKKQFLYGLRTLWNKFLYQHYGLNIKEYKPKKDSDIKRKVNKKTYSLEQYKDVIEELRKEYERIKEKEQKTIKRYIERIIKGVVEQKNDMVKKNKEKLFNKLEKMEKQNKISEKDELEIKRKINTITLSF